MKTVSYIDYLGILKVSSLSICISIIMIIRNAMKKNMRDFFYYPDSYLLQISDINYHLKLLENSSFLTSVTRFDPCNFLGLHKFESIYAKTASWSKCPSTLFFMYSSFFLTKLIHLSWMVSTVLAMPAVSLLIASEGSSFSGIEAKHLVTSFSATELIFKSAFLSTLHSLLIHCKQIKIVLSRRTH